jgi:hypothetical protein
MQNKDQIKELLEEKDKRIYELEKKLDEVSTDLAGSFYQAIEMLSTIITFTERTY